MTIHCSMVISFSRVRASTKHLGKAASGIGYISVVSPKHGQLRDFLYDRGRPSASDQKYQSESIYSQNQTTVSCVRATLSPPATERPCVHGIFLCMVLESRGDWPRAPLRARKPENGDLAEAAGSGRSHALEDV